MPSRDSQDVGLGIVCRDGRACMAGQKTLSTPQAGRKPGPFEDTYHPLKISDYLADTRSGHRGLPCCPRILTLPLPVPGPTLPQTMHSTHVSERAIGRTCVRKYRRMGIVFMATARH